MDLCVALFARWIIEKKRTDLRLVLSSATLSSEVRAVFKNNNFHSTTEHQGNGA